MTTDPFDMDFPIGEHDQAQMDERDPRSGHEAEDAAEQSRASRYLEALGAEERARREQINYVEQYSLTPRSWAERKEHLAVGECPVCGNRSLVGSHCDDEQYDETIIGHCIVCSYERTVGVADVAASDIQLQRAIDRD
ncbi:hypothetical protein GCM10027187_40980 [Streptosporangium sandarakinum]|uniref:Uncharacterized protein n=1 Tax=Streptosporangium sandarakinum TaxID=1260955 RepID=A0A852V905_9ACTN|nr:hypothetical protein [Streptosporangium sandarakinum]NYF44570.1 hypothetical protein [Streptosporangium sandarakinum]